MLKSILAHAAVAVISAAFSVSLAALVYRLRKGRRW